MEISVLIYNTFKESLKVVESQNQEEKWLTR